MRRIEYEQLFSGARQSSGAARTKQAPYRQKSNALEQAKLAAPEDGRAPLKTYDYEIFDWLDSPCPTRPTNLGTDKTKD